MSCQVYCWVNFWGSTGCSDYFPNIQFDSCIYKWSSICWQLLTNSKQMQTCKPGTFFDKYPCPILMLVVYTSWLSVPHGINKTNPLSTNLFPIKTSSWLSNQNWSWILREHLQCQSPLTQFLREHGNIQAAMLLKQTALILVKVLVTESMRKMNSEPITLATILFNEQTYLSFLTTVPNLPSWLLSSFWSRILREKSTCQNLREHKQIKTFPASWLLNPSILKYPFTSATIAEYLWGSKGSKGKTKLPLWPQLGLQPNHGLRPNLGLRTQLGLWLQLGLWPNHSLWPQLGLWPLAASWPLAATLPLA